MLDQKNLTHGTTNHANQQVLCQILAINQEYHAKLVYNEGKSNISADGLSRLPFDKTESCKFCEVVFATETSERTVNPIFHSIFAK